MGPFYIRRLKRRPWRALCALLLCAAFAALLCRLASQASAQRDALANVHEHMDVRCTISNVQGTSTSHLRMGNGYLWRVQNPEGMLTPYIRDLQLTKEFYYTSQALQVEDGVLTGVTDPCCADVLDPDLGAEVTYFVQDFFDSDAAQCLVPEAFYQQLGEGGRLTLQVMDPLGDGQSHTYTCTVAGFYLGAGTEIFLSWPCAERLMEDISETLSCDSMTFFARDNRQLSALAEAAATTFCPVDPTGSFTIFMYAMTVHDSQYLETVDALETNIRRTQLLIPALLLGALAAGFLSSYLAMRGERRSFALMRAVGMPRGAADPCHSRRAASAAGHRLRHRHPLGECPRRRRAAFVHRSGDWRGRHPHLPAAPCRAALKKGVIFHARDHSQPPRRVLFLPDQGTDRARRAGGALQL